MFKSVDHYKNTRSSCDAMFCVWGSVLVFLLQAGDIANSAAWPRGTYALLQPITGCPTGWKGKGSLYQDTEDTNPSNSKSEILRINGYVAPSYVIRSFCVKTVSDNSVPNWPTGQYCIYRKHSDNKLTGMVRGSIEVEDEQTYNLDTAINGFDDNDWILYDLDGAPGHLKLNFICRTVGNKQIPIALPYSKPFYLLPYGSRECQQVKWMVATSEWIKYDLNNPMSSISVHGETPFHSITQNKDITMYYCHYQSCRYTLRSSRGVFQSPRFPHGYPDGQLCSWTIIVPVNHIIHVHFTNFSLYEKNNGDSLRYDIKTSSGYKLNKTFYGDVDPFTLTAYSYVYFYFRSDATKNSTGFRAEYNVFIPQETTPTSAPFPTTKPTTYTQIRAEDKSTIPTTTKNQSNNDTTITFEKSHASDCERTGTIVAIVIPLVCLILIIVIVVDIVYRCRSVETKCEKCEARFNSDNVLNPTYDRGDILMTPRTRTATMNTTLGVDDKHSQLSQTLSRDQPEYEAPDYSKQNGTADPNMDPEYHELEPIDNNVPDVVYDVLEGPDPDGPPDDQTYQALDNQTTQNPLYQSTNPAAVVTKNPLYDSLA